MTAGLGDAQASRSASLNSSRTKWAWTLGTFFGVGLLRPGPGTYGSIAALLLWMGAAWLAVPHLAIATAVAALAALLIGIPAASTVEKESGGSDPQHVVLDEVVGQWVALIGISPTWRHAVAALLLFRLFDITKPPPARQFDRMHGGFGIMMDDVAAGVYALILGHLLMLWF